MTKNQPATPELRRHLNVWDAASVVIGIIVGSGIYKLAPGVANNVSGPGMLLLVWIIGGAISLIGALCYAELASRVKEPGGEYAYLKNSYGRPIAFLFAWAQFLIIRPGSIGAMAYVFAEYFQRFLPWSLGHYSLVILACSAVIALTTINALGVTIGKWTQNVLSLTKVIGLLAVIIVAFLLISPATSEPAVLENAQAATDSDSGRSLSLAFIFVLFAFGGWNDMTYIAAEIKQPRRNIVRALILGTGTVVFIYLLLNAAFLYGLGFQGVRESKLVASDLIELRFPRIGGNAISLLVAVSCLGAIQGMIWTGSRLYFIFGKDFSLFHWLGHWNPRFKTPVRSLVGQALITMLLIIGFGPKPDGFEKMVIFTTPVFWFFLLLIGISIFWYRKQTRPRPDVYEIPLYPLTPILFCMSCIVVLWLSINHVWDNSVIEAYWSLVVLAIGAVLAVFVALSSKPEPVAKNRAATGKSADNKK
ncbi:MAG: amino acid permease [Blastopirellula sp.]|nr:MAG: amino acid permease [Blastopirellula sp.]